MSKHVSQSMQSSRSMPLRGVPTRLLGGSLDARSKEGEGEREGEGEVDGRDREDGTEEKKEPPAWSIVGGSVADEVLFAHQVSVQILKGSASFICGGTLIDPQFVVTAAHCVLDGNSSGFVGIPFENLTVGVGTQALEQSRRVPISQVWAHPAFNFTAFDHDIALLKLGLSLPITDKVRPIKIAVNNDTNYLAAGADITISGWGAMYQQGEAAAVLHMATVDSLPDGCSNYTPPRYSLPFDPTLMVCAGCGLGFVDSCSGDSGGPATVASESGGCPILVGTASFGERCGQVGFPGVYTRISSHLWWIESLVEDKPFGSQYPTKPTMGCDRCNWSLSACALASAATHNVSRCIIEAWLASSIRVKFEPCLFRAIDELPSNQTKKSQNTSLVDGGDTLLYASGDDRAALRGAGGTGQIFGLKQPIQAFFQPRVYNDGLYIPNGHVFFLRGNQVASSGSSTVDLAGVKVQTPFVGEVEASGEAEAVASDVGFPNWKYTWPAAISFPNRSCTPYYAYLAVFISADLSFIQVSRPIRPSIDPVIN
ncbi:hypothetical protein CBR_g37520 [Chara braunii]|uniref:Peptidase S1 domain-containing protein n=1 Tax=Chara braunii TaxID=69332 RepID=A0A388LN75_CHABU|nr:hypothetical protein CBR_g37520 [Chara braunii]|eukprot:GBG83719.1 hypothetical protein CBR_g37520 [Chara braunii]